MALRAPLLALVLLAGLLVPPLGAARAEESQVAPPTQATVRALEGLASPLERTRRAAVRNLIADLPGSRAAVLAALSGAKPAVQLLLIEVLAADASLPAIRALLERMEAGDEALAVRIRLLLAQGAQTAGRVLEAWTQDPTLGQGADGEQSERARLLERLLRRAEAERLFVTRKSKTGGTGSYRGQYEVLRPYRKEALEVCAGILTDRAVPIPGVYTAGTYTFLRPPPIHVRTNELIGMAAHAFSELARSTDFRQLLTLSSHLQALWNEFEGLSPFYEHVRYADVLSQYADLLVALYLVTPDKFGPRLDLFLEQLQYDSSWQRALGTSYHPIVLLRIGRHEKAVWELELLLRRDEVTSSASAHYNLACAYAQWGNELEGGARAARLHSALDHLEQAVEHQWLDIGWMDQDRDLEPIRDTDRYRELAKRVHAELAPEGD